MYTAALLEIVNYKFIRLLVCYAECTCGNLSISMMSEEQKLLYCVAFWVEIKHYSDMYFVYMHVILMIATCKCI